MKKKLNKILPPILRKKKIEESFEQAIRDVPRITNETVSEHREEVLSSARKFIYPLQHSAQRVVLTSISILGIIIIAFFGYSILALYKFRDTSAFMYHITQVVPFPVAKAGSSFVSYENYLSELRHYQHYYATQQRVDFSTDAGRQQMTEFRKRALDIVVNNAYIKQLADQHNVTVSDTEVNDEITLLRSQNRLGSSDQTFSDVLKQFWGWSVDDFKRELKQQLLSQKVVAALDTATQKRASDVYTQIKAGGDFAVLAKQYSDDVATKDAGGDFGVAININNRNLPAKVIDALFKLKAGETSGIINTGTGLEILKVKSNDGVNVQASHILFNFQPIDTYLSPLKKKQAPKFFIGS